MQYSDLLLPIVIFTVTVIVSWSTFRAYDSQKASAFLIDIAGRQRMLSQRLYLELISGLEHHTGQPQTLRALEESAKALRNGGQIQNPRKPDSWVNIGEQPSKRLAEKLDEQITAIKALSNLMTQEFKTDTSFSLLSKISLNADETVQIYIEESQEGIVKILIQNIAFIIVLASLGLGLNRLIVNRKYQLKELAKAKEIAMQASEAKSMFLANMSHEIRTPLNAIIGMAELLQTVDLKPEHKRYVFTLNRAGETLLNLVNDILDLSRVESGQMELDLSTFDLNELIDQVTQIIVLRAHQKGLELLFYIDPNVPKTIIADRNRLLQILMNLLSNAVKFTKTGEVSLKIELEQLAFMQQKDPRAIQLKISVADTGIGIAEEKLSSIFEKFVQADSSVSFNYGGTGLGLAISKKLVELMGGHFGVTSNLGKGSIFSFTIKAHSIGQIQEEAKSQDYTQLAGRRILIVDDNDTNRFIIRRYLDDTLCVLEEASDGEEALTLLRKAKLENWSYDLILLDYRMPNKNGFEVAEIIKSEQLGTSTIISLLTSDDCQNDLAKLPKIGISDYLIKPIRRNDFLNLVLKAFIRKPNKITYSPAINPSISGNKFKVLVVDDIADNRFVVTAYLDSKSFEIDEASNGQQALNFVNEKDYDLIFMDMRMSPMDGYETTTKIRNWETQKCKKKRIPIVALTAHALKEDVSKAKQAGCDYHLTKPITKSRLLELVETILKISTPSELRTIPQLSTPTTAEEFIPIDTESFLRPRLAQYIENRKNELNNIHEALAKSDFESIITIGHNVAGTAGIYGMVALGEIARKVELAATDVNTDKIGVLIKEMESYLNKVRIMET